MVARFLALFILLTLLCSASAPTASADAIYTYVGAPFKHEVGIMPSGVTGITGSFTLSNPLGANFNGSITPLSFSFSDGATTVTQDNSALSSDIFSVGTGATGTINVWLFDLFSPNSTTPVVNLVSSSEMDSAVYFDASFSVIGTADNPGAAAGNWTAVPEPSSLILLGSGLLGALGVARRKLRV